MLTGNSTSYFPVDLNSDPGSVPGFVAAARWPPPGLFTWAKRARTLNHTHTQINKALCFLFSYLLIFKLLIAARTLAHVNQEG